MVAECDGGVEVDNDVFCCGEGVGQRGFSGGFAVYDSISFRPAVKEIAVFHRCGECDIFTRADALLHVNLHVCRSAVIHERHVFANSDTLKIGNLYCLGSGRVFHILCGFFRFRSHGGRLA